MQRRDPNALAGVLGRLMAEVDGVPDEESNFPAFQPTCSEDLRVKLWQAELPLRGLLPRVYYPRIDLFLYGEVVVDKKRRGEPHLFQRCVRVHSDAAPGGEHRVFYCSPPCRPRP